MPFGTHKRWIPLISSVTGPFLVLFAIWVLRELGRNPLIESYGTQPQSYGEKCDITALAENESVVIDCFSDWEGRQLLLRGGKNKTIIAYECRMLWPKFRNDAEPDPIMEPESVYGDWQLRDGDLAGMAFFFTLLRMRSNEPCVSTHPLHYRVSYLRDGKKIGGDRYFDATSLTSSVAEYVMKPPEEAGWWAVNGLALSPQEADKIVTPFMIMGRKDNAAD